MEYTHYWTYNPKAIKDTEELRKKFLVARNVIKVAKGIISRNPFIHKGQAGGYYDDVPCKIKGGLGKGTPMINESQIWFNGDEKIGMDHETFDIKWYPEGGSVKDFCKTNRKPYDLLVCVSLLAFKHAFNDTNVFTFSSDGDNWDWAEAKDLFTRITGSYVGKIFPEEAELEVA